MESQNSAILAHLKEGNKLTSLQAWMMFGCSALHSRISDIRNKIGQPVDGEWIAVDGFGGKKKHVIEYSISKSEGQ